jgi:hypothetical protein
MASPRCLGYKRNNYAQPQHSQEKEFVPASKTNAFLYGHGNVHRPAVCAWDFMAGQSREFFHALNRRLRSRYLRKNFATASVRVRTGNFS